MSRDLQTVLREAAPGPTGPFDEAELVDRALRQRRRTRVGRIAASVVVIAAVSFLAAQWLTGTNEVEIVTDPPPSTLTGSAAWRQMPEGPVDGRVFPSVVWADGRLVVWGGEKPSEEQWHDTGAVFDPSTMSWSEMAPAPISARSEHVTVWTGSEMLVCCGRVRGQSGAAAYDPSSDRWRQLPTSPLADVEFALAVWTGQELIVTGGVTDGGASDNRNTVAYDPDTDAWRELAELPEIPGGNLRDTRLSGVWAHDQMIVWPADGRGGLAYDPGTDEWSKLAPRDVEARPRSASLVWTGEEILMVGVGGDATGSLRVEGHETSNQLIGAAYRPETGSWRTLDPGLPRAESFGGNVGSQAAVWTGNRMLVWTGYLGSGADDRGSLMLSYDPATDNWQHLETAPTMMSQPELAWTGEYLLAIGQEASLLLGPQRDGGPPPPSIRVDPVDLSAVDCPPTASCLPNFVLDGVRYTTGTGCETVQRPRIGEPIAVTTDDRPGRDVPTALYALDGYSPADGVVVDWQCDGRVLATPSADPVDADQALSRAQLRCDVLIEPARSHRCGLGGDAQWRAGPGWYDYAFAPFPGSVAAADNAVAAGNDAVDDVTWRTDPVAVATRRYEHEGVCRDADGDPCPLDVHLSETDGRAVLEGTVHPFPDVTWDIVIVVQRLGDHTWWTTAMTIEPRPAQ